MFVHKMIIYCALFCFHYPLAWRISFKTKQICCRHNRSAIACVKNFYLYLWWGFDEIFFITFKIYCINLMSVVFGDKSAITCFIMPLKIMCLFFSLAVFQLVTLSLVRSSLSILYLSLVLFVFILLLGVHIFLGCLVWYFPPNLGNI